jgi:hypothetical protein
MIDLNAQGRGHRQNIERYCRLLATELTDLERQYLHKRIAEEHAQLERLKENEEETAGRRTKSRASSAKRSYWPSAQRYSTVTFFPSTKPASARPCRNAVSRSAPKKLTPRKPMTGSAGCCNARTGIGHIAAAPPSSDMNSRLFMCGWPPPGKRKCCVPHRGRLQSCVRPSRSPDGLLALMESANRGLIIRAGSMSQ